MLEEEDEDGEEDVDAEEEEEEGVLLLLVLEVGILACGCCRSMGWDRWAGPEPKAELLQARCPRPLCISL